MGISGISSVSPFAGDSGGESGSFGWLCFGNALSGGRAAFSVCVCFEAEPLRVATGDCEALSSVHSSSSCSSSPSSSSSSITNFAAAFECRLSGFVFWELERLTPAFALVDLLRCADPLRFKETFDAFFLIDTFEATRGRLTVELFLLTCCCVDGLVDGVCAFAFVFRTTPPSSTPTLVSLLRFFPYEGFLVCIRPPTACALCCFSRPVLPVPDGDAFEIDCVEDDLSFIVGRRPGDGEVV